MSIAKQTRKRKQKETSHRIGLYIRVSTEEQAQNPEGSIKSQEQRLRSQIKLLNYESYFGEVVEVFIDRARSGKDTNRPELQRLLQAIRKKEITLVMVSELSRLSRSIKDFSDIWELMRENGCEFQSLREQFDTTSAAGEMVIYTIANIAQFERKQCSERISANLLARAKRGLYNGGSVPLGYKLDPDQKGHLAIDEETAPLIKEIYQTFLREGFLSKAGKSLNERGFRMPKKRQGGGNKVRLGYFTTDNLHHILRNKVYVGIREYTENGERKEVNVCWPALIDRDTFEQVQTNLSKNIQERRKSSSPQRYPYLLSGLVRCGKCDDGLPGKSAWGNGGKIGYYEHGWATKRQSCLNKKVFKCDPHRVLAKRLEPAVWKEMVDLMTKPDLAKSIIERAQKYHHENSGMIELHRMKSKLDGTKEQIEALVEHLSKIPKNVSPEPIYRQMAALEEYQKKLQLEYDQLKREGTQFELPVGFKNYLGFIQKIRCIPNEDEVELKEKLIRQFIYRVEVLPETFRLHYYVGENHFPEEGGPKGPSHLPLKALETLKTKKASPSPVEPETPESYLKNLNLFGSKRLTSGWLDWD